MVRTDFFQECPVCGRSLRIHVAYLGRRMKCGHCGGRFLATVPVDQRAAPPDQLLARANELLTRSAQQLGASPSPRNC